MNHDDPHFPADDATTEARIVAWVLGEASPFEVAELTRVLSEKPELVEFKKRMEAVHCLLGNAVSPAAPLQLSPERRRELLSKLGVSPTNLQMPAGALSGIGASNTKNSPGGSPVTKETPVLVYPTAAPRRILWMKGLSIACSVSLAFMIVKVGFFAPRASKLDNPMATEEARNGSFELSRRAAANTTGELATIDTSREHKELAEPVALPSSAAEIALSAPAQPVAPAKDQLDEGALESDQPVKLDRFVVDGEDAGSYGASSTLAGTRVRTDFKVDVPQLSSSPNIAFSADAPEQWLTGENYNINVDVNQTYADGTPNPKVGRPYVGNAASGQNLSSTTVQNPAPITATEELRPEDFFGKSKINTFNYYGSLRLTTPLSQRSMADKSAYTVENRFDKIETPAEAYGFDSSNQSLESSKKHEWRNWEAVNIALNQKFLDDRFSSWPDEIAFGSKEPSNFRADVAGISRSWGAAYHLPKSISDRLPWSPDLRGFLAYDLKNSPQDAGKTLAKKAKVSAAPIAARNELTAAAESISTFSLHVSDVSFRLAVASMARGERPDPASIRPEEFYNAFDYGDPAANVAEQVSCRIEQSAYPELQQRNLLRIAVRVPATGRGASQPLRLTVLLDTSGSMQRDDRAAAVRRAMQVLVSLLGPADRVTLIGFSRTPHLLAESVRGDQAQALLKIVAQTPAEGGTNLEEALKLAGQLARRQLESSAQNRIVLLTDGAANLGDANPAQLAASVVKFRQEGIAFDACGVGSDSVDDTMLEALTRDGDGRYTLLTNADASVEAFAHQLAGAFRPAAKNVKVQVRFNPARVGHYRLIGFEQHRLKTEDFRNDQVDAAELAADEAAVAVYQVEPLPQGEGELGEVFVRFQDVATGNMIERSWALPYDAHVAAFDRASPAMQLAGAATLVAEKLQGEPVRLEVLRGPINALRSHYKNEAAVQDLITLFNELRRYPDGK